MKKVMFIVLCLLGVTVFAGYASAATAYNQWAGANGVAWNAAASNWNNNIPVGSHILPTATDAANVAGSTDYKVGFKTPLSAPSMTSGTMNADVLVVGGGNLATPGFVTIGGTNVNVSQYITLAANTTDWGVMNLTSGTIDTGCAMNNGGFFASQKGWGKLDMDGGIINVGVTHWNGSTQDFSKTVFGAFTLAESVGSIGNAYLDGGVINADSFAVGLGTGHLYITGGTLVLNGDKTSVINPLIGGVITTTNAGGSIMDVYNASTGKTTVWATPEPATVCLLGLGAMALIRKNKR
jgi:hypothetical protein